MKRATMFSKLLALPVSLGRLGSVPCMQPSARGCRPPRRTPRNAHGYKHVGRVDDLLRPAAELEPRPRKRRAAAKWKDRLASLPSTGLAPIASFDARMEWRAQTRGGAVMRSVISALAGFAVAGSLLG